jgi:hypothetical protein
MKIICLSLLSVAILGVANASAQQKETVLAQTDLSKTNALNIVQTARREADLYFAFVEPNFSNYDDIMKEGDRLAATHNLSKKDYDSYEGLCIYEGAFKDEFMFRLHAWHEKVITGSILK